MTVVPGVTAALATAARLGAPLADDWATLSLSDLHLPLETVERRLNRPGAVGHRARALQPGSNDAHQPFDRALAILREHRAGENARWWWRPTSRARASGSSTRPWRPSTRRP